MPDTSLTLTPQAQETISAMLERIREVAIEYGDNSQEHRDMLWSLLYALTNMIRLGGRITKEDDLGLYGSSFIDYGIVFFPKRHGDERDPLLGEWSCHS